MKNIPKQMQSNYPLISIQILNWNRFDDTIEAIKSAKNQTYPNIEIIVLDNCSTEIITNSFVDFFPDIIFIQLDKNYGCPGGRNRGIDYCQGEFIFYLDNDGILQESAVMNAYKLFLKHSELAIVTGNILFYKDRDDIDYNITPINKSNYSNLFSGGVSMHLKSIYDQIGRFHDDFMYGSEETNFAMKLVTTNKRIMYAENVVLWHKFSELARDNQFNFVSRYANKFVSYWEFLPTLEVFKFTLWYIFGYSFHAIKKGYFLAFLKSFKTTFRRAISSRKASKIRLTRQQFKHFKTDKI